MTSSRLELLRGDFEMVENLEKALSQAFSYKDKYPKETVICDILIAKFQNIIQQKSKEILEIYNDIDGLFREENDVYSGQKFASESQYKRAVQTQYAMMHSANMGQEMQQQVKSDVWSNFYEKYQEIDTFHNKYNQATLIAENDNLDAEAMFNKIMEEIIAYCEKTFTAEEGNGKYVDMHNLYLQFCNIKKLRKHNSIKSDDYLTWLQNFDKLYLIPLHLKNSTKYENYLVNLKDYLIEFFRKSQPLVDWQKIEDQQEETFTSEWDQCSLFGWEETIQRMNGQSIAEKQQNPLHCVACNKTFANENVFMHHKKGKVHVKAVNELSKKVQANQVNNVEMAQNDQISSEFNDNEKKKLKRIAHLETWILRMKDLLSDVIHATENLIRKKQSKHYNEIEADYEMNQDAKNPLLGGEPGSDDEDERPKYNPKNLPMGWDGKPIPYWLYKLHGLGIEFKCEICGGASYWGRRSFEKHFQEWRHAYGMKCLKIPNTVHFKDVTDIEHALRLHKKILSDNFEGTFKPDFQEEFEDVEGNLYSRKQYIDLKRQGII